MADASNGMSRQSILLIAVLATPVVLVLIFWLAGSGGGGSSAKATATSNLPDLRTKGLQWADAQAKDAGFGDVQTHDALGRNRRWHDDKDWVVCFETPAPGAVADGTTVQLGVVQTDERCPSKDQALYDKAGAQMPDLTNRTAYMSSQILGNNASVRYLQRNNGDEVKRGLGDWRVCAQTPKPGQRFDGVPVTTLVVPYEQRC
jgi:hypothetical protein